MMAQTNNQVTSNAGVARIKAEFLVQDHVRELNLNFVATKDKKQMSSENDQETPPKKKLKGQNKYRPREKKRPKSEKLCFKIGTDGFCTYGNSCCYSHDVSLYMEKKPPDIGDACYLYETFGKCPYGFSCRFASQHIKDGKNLVINDVWEKNKDRKVYLNVLNRDIQQSLRKRSYDFSKSEAVLKALNIGNVETTQTKECNKNADISVSSSDSLSELTVPLSSDDAVENKIKQSTDISVIHSKNDMESKKEHNIDTIIHLSKTESNPSVPLSNNSDMQKMGIIDTAAIESNIKKVDFKDKLYLAPLTTVGNLPFRRVCKEFGADITCSEMAVALSILQGQQSEWALLKRHYTEDIFGVQLCGSQPNVMTRCSQLLSEKTSFDFIDLNLGCPLDAIYHKGAGCGLMNRMRKLEGIIYGVSSVIQVPLTLKMRTGIYANESIATNVINKIHQWKDRVSLITLHGRSREQRYTKSADWDYIKKCNDLAYPIPLFGNGDILSYEDYNMRRAQTGVSGAMIARGALIKPWIFKEIKDQIHWDISSSERFDILKKFSNYGLEHWGSDSEGVEKTRRFLLEWLSFLHRYIPVGLLECVPQRINERPPPYHGRNDLETLMASPSCSDWIKISEMLLGPVPEHFIFLPKHKANAYK